MTYNEADGNIYGVISESVLVTVDKLTGKVTTVGKIGNEDFTTLTLACDGNGTFYCNEYDTPNVYKFTLDTMDAPEKVATVWDDTFTSFNASSMEVDPNTGHLIWASYEYIWTYGGAYRLLFAYIFEIYPENDYYVEKHNDVNYELTGLLIPDKNQGPNGAWADPAEKADSIMLSKTSIDMWKGSSTSLAAVVQPWTALNQGVTWTSSDESIATVDAAGNVTAVSAGTCLITATSNKNPDVSASCTVTVNHVPVTLMGVMQDAAGNPMLFSWDLEHAETWTPGLPWTLTWWPLPMTPPTKSCMCTIAIRSYTRLIQPPVRRSKQAVPPPCGIWHTAPRTPRKSVPSSPASMTATSTPAKIPWPSAAQRSMQRRT